MTLTPTEYELLRVLAQGAGRVLTHEALLRQVWAGRGKANPKIVRAYVKRLRHQLGDDTARPAWIVNERGVGYRMCRKRSFATHGRGPRRLLTARSKEPEAA